MSRSELYSSADMMIIHVCNMEDALVQHDPAAKEWSVPVYMNPKRIPPSSVPLNGFGSAATLGAARKLAYDADEVLSHALDYMFAALSSYEYGSDEYKAADQAVDVLLSRREITLGAHGFLCGVQLREIDRRSERRDRKRESAR
jgi:hypothetical protein